MCQNAAARMMTAARKFDHITPVNFTGFQSIIESRTIWRWQFTWIGADVLGGRLSGNLDHCWQATPAVRWHRDTVSTKNKDHARDDEFHGRRSLHLEQFISCPVNGNSLPIDVRLTSAGPPVRLIDSASENHLWRALQIYSSSSSS